jgi:hypothetical protein
VLAQASIALVAACAMHFCTHMRSAISLVMMFGAAAAPGAHAEPLAPGHYAHMEMKLEKTFLGVDVAHIDLWFDAATRDKFTAIAAGQKYSDALAEQIARAAIDANDVSVQLQFLRNVSLGRFLDSVRKSLKNAEKAGYITPENYETSWHRVQAGFAPLSKRGFKKGDHLLYRAHAGTLRTQLVSGNQSLVDVTVNDDGARRSMLGSYFAPGSDFRGPLIRDLWSQ